MAKEALKDAFKNPNFKKAMAKRDDCIAKGMKPDEADKEFEKALDEDEGVDEGEVSKALGAVADLVGRNTPDELKKAIEVAMAEQKSLYADENKAWRGYMFESFKLVARSQADLHKALADTLGVVDTLNKSISAQNDLIKSLQAPKGDDALNKGNAQPGADALAAAAKPEAAAGSKQAIPTAADQAAAGEGSKVTPDEFLRKSFAALEKGDLGNVEVKAVADAVAMLNLGTPIDQLAKEVGKYIGL